MLRGSGKPKKQFQRPSVTVSTEIQDAKKEWRDADPREIEVGDIIQGQGLVVGIGDVVQVSDPFGWWFHFEMKNGTTYVHRCHPYGLDRDTIVPTIRAFVRVRG